MRSPSVYVVSSASTFIIYKERIKWHLEKMRPVVSNIPVLADRNGQRDIQNQVFQKGELFLDRMTVTVLSVLAV